MLSKEMLAWAKQQDLEMNVLWNHQEIKNLKKRMGLAEDNIYKNQRLNIWFHRNEQMEDSYWEPPNDSVSTTYRNLLETIKSGEMPRMLRR